MSASDHHAAALGRIHRVCLALVALGSTGIALGALVSPERVWANLLLATFLLAGFGLAGLLFLAFHYLTGAKWSEPLRRVPEVLASTLPCTALALGAVVLVGLNYYPWMHENLSQRPTFWFKAAWLQPAFFSVRTIAYVLVWALLAPLLVRSSRGSDLRPCSGRQRAARLSAAFLVLFALTFWLATTDWILSLEPEWSSTIFAVYHFAGVLSSGLALITLLTVWLRRGALARSVTDGRLHDLGKLVFGFSSFWMYLWFSQYLLIWYTNIPEEAAYFARRMQGDWLPLSLLNLGLNWAVPFLVLLPRASKRSGSVLVKVALVMLVGRWLDLYLAVLPAVAGQGPVFGFAELGVLLAAMGGFGVWLSSALERVPQTVPKAARGADADQAAVGFGLGES